MTTLVLLEPSPSSATAIAPRLASPHGEPAPWPTELDARGGTPPKPVPAILAALRLIPVGATQYVRTRAYPTDLLAALAKAGVQAEASPLSDGTWRMAATLRAA